MTRTTLHSTLRTIAAVPVVLALGACRPDGPSEETGPDDGVDTHDPLSMPENPTLDPADFNSSAECESCHPTHFAEWELSRHARSMLDPVFRALVQIRQDELDGAEDQFCTQCHSSICTRGGECVDGFSFDALPPIALEGITCEACHKVESVQRPYNSGHVLDPDGPIRGPIEDPVASAFHESEYAEHYEQAEFCGGCHDVIETSGLNLERPYEEWLESPSNPEQTCQDCHMPAYQGQAADGAPMRTLHRHRFIGVDLPMEDDVDPAAVALIDAEIEALLADAATLSLSSADDVAAGEQLDVQVTITNEIDGHAFPTGSTFVRQVWVELTVRDAADAVIYQTGDLDANGDLRNVWSTVAPFTDPDLIMLSSSLLDPSGQPVLFSWQASEHASNAISPRHDRTYTLFVPVPVGTPGPLSVDATLHFRSHPPFLLRQLGLDDLVDRAVVRDIASDTRQVTVSG